jgi:hypothetical protein
MAVAHVVIVSPPIETTEPSNPRSIGGRVQLREKFTKESRVLGRQGDDPQPPLLFGSTDVSPAYFTLTAVARLFTRPEKGTSTLINGLDNPSREEPRIHGVGKHGG